MVIVNRRFVVPGSRAAVIAYLADFSTAVEWDPGTVSCVRLDGGPVEVGAKWRNTSKVLGRETELDYELVELREDGLVLRGENKTAISIDDITVRDAPGGSEVDYTARVQFKGIAKITTPIMQRVFEGLGDGVVKDMTAAIAKLPA